MTWQVMKTDVCMSGVKSWKRCWSLSGWPHGPEGRGVREPLLARELGPVTRER